MKLLLCVLSNETFEEKCHFIFRQSCDFNMEFTKVQLTSVLHTLTKLGDFLQERTWFGTSLITTVINDAFANVRYSKYNIDRFFSNIYILFKEFLFSREYFQKLVYNYRLLLLAAYPTKT